MIKLETRHYTQKVFYALHIRPNDIGNRHLIYKLSINQILITKDYQAVPVSDDLIEAMNKTNSYDNKIQVMHLKNNHSTVQDDHCNNHNKACLTPVNNTNNPEDKNQDELDRPLQLNCFTVCVSQYHDTRLTLLFVCICS